MPMKLIKNIHYWLRGLQEAGPSEADPVLDYVDQNAPHKGLKAEDKLELLADAARLVLFTEPGSSEEYQAVYNLGWIMSTYVDADKTSVECRKAVVAYEPQVPGLRNRLVIAWQFLTTGKTKVLIERSNKLSDWS